MVLAVYSAYCDTSLARVMNYKLLFPTCRARYRWVLQTLQQAYAGEPCGEMLNVGCGEGDFDRALKQHCDRLVSIDVDAEDVAHARQLNLDCVGLEYDVQDALDLPYEDGRFNAVTCLEVIEHVSDSHRLLGELARVVKPGGSVVITCPSAEFPVTYDPINWLLAHVGKHVSIGAYGYGHSWLIREEDIFEWASSVHLEVVSIERLAKSLASTFECYWPSVLQRMLKANAGNQVGGRHGVYSLRPTNGEPLLVRLTDHLIDLDRRLLADSRKSVGLGIHLHKPLQSANMKSTRVARTDAAEPPPTSSRVAIASTKTA